MLLHEKREDPHWARENGLMLDTVRPFHVAAYIEQMPGSKPTIKQKLAAIRMLYDFLVVRQLVPVNPTASVRGPKYVVKRGKTPVWSREDAKKFLESIPRDDLAGLRDRTTKLYDRTKDEITIGEVERIQP